MARARNIKPGFFANEELVELPFETRLLFIGLWTIADRAGRLEDRPKRIKMALFPADSVDVDACLNELQKSGFLLRYEHGGERFIQVLAFNKHQNPHKDEKASTIPAPCEHGASTVQEQNSHDGNPADSLIPSSLIPDSPIEVKAPQAAPAAPKKSRKPAKTSLPDDFCISEAVRDWADRNGVQHLDRHFDSFVTKVRAKGYTYVNWDAALQNAISDDWAKLNTHQARGSPPGYQTANDKAKSLADRLTGNRNEQRHTIIDITPSPADQLD